MRDYSGDVTGLINARGELIGSYLYDPWGVLLETYLNTFEEETAEWTDADRAEYMRVLNLNPIRYKSYYYDTETGFYYLQSRYYDPITTRFINADGLISTGTGVLGYNMFVYCNNNPIMNYDSNGMRMVSILEKLRDAGAQNGQHEPNTIIVPPHSIDKDKEKLKKNPNSLVWNGNANSTYSGESDASVIARMLYGEDFNAKEAHLWLLDNRLRDDRFHCNSYRNVVLSQNQFACMWESRSLDPGAHLGNEDERIAWESCVDMAYKLLDCGIYYIKFEYSDIPFIYSHSYSLDFANNHPNGCPQGNTWFYY